MYTYWEIVYKIQKDERQKQKFLFNKLTSMVQEHVFIYNWRMDFEQYFSQAGLCIDEITSNNDKGELVCVLHSEDKGAGLKFSFMVERLALIQYGIHLSEITGNSRNDANSVPIISFVYNLNWNISVENTSAGQCNNISIEYITYSSERHAWLFVPCSRLSAYKRHQIETLLDMEYCRYI